MTVGENIKNLRIERGLTQKQLGELCCPPIAESTIRRYELGNLNPKLATLRRIKEALSVTLSELIDDWSIYSTGEFSKDWELAHELPRRTSQNFLMPAECELQKSDKLNGLFNKLNEKGQVKIVEYADDLTKIPEYQKSPEE